MSTSLDPYSTPSSARTNLTVRSQVELRLQMSEVQTPFSHSCILSMYTYLRVVRHVRMVQGGLGFIRLWDGDEVPPPLVALPDHGISLGHVNAVWLVLSYLHYNTPQQWEWSHIGKHKRYTCLYLHIAKLFSWMFTATWEQSWGCTFAIDMDNA